MRILKKDLCVERLRRSGPGGQNRNRRATGVRITHVPTGIVVMATERSSQARNMKEGLERLERKLTHRFAKKKKRKKTSVPRASKEKRLENKRVRSEQKKLRKRLD